MAIKISNSTIIDDSRNIINATNAEITGISTLGNVNISSGIITATTGVVTYYGDASNLTGLTGASQNTYGNNDYTPVITVDSNGRITGITTALISGSGAISEIVEDLTPQLGGNLDLNGKDITGTGNFNVSGVITATTFVGNLTGTATTATNLSDAANITTGTINSSRLTGSYNIDISGNATTATTAGVATALQNARTFEITGDVVASPISFDGTGNVSLAATIQPNSVGLGTDTFGDYVQSVSGTSNQITVTSGTGEGSTPTLSIPSQFTAPQDVTVTRDLQVNRNLNVTGNITIGGTSAFIDVQELRVFDSDIVLGFRTDAFGNDASNDNTANHGGVAIASTEGTPLVNLFIAGIETAPATYKKIMWFKEGTFAGLGTDAWLSNYAVGIGSTQFPTGTRLAAGAVQFTERDLAVVRNINASGIVTATTFVGALTGTATSTTNIPNLTGDVTSNNTTTTLATVNSNVGTYGDAGAIPSITVNAKGLVTGVTTVAPNNGQLSLSVSGTGLSGSATFTANQSSSSTFTVTSNATDSNTSGTIVARDGSGNFSAGTITANLIGTATTATNLSDAANITTGTISSSRLTGSYNIDISGNATTATTAGIATYATSSGIATNLKGGGGGYIPYQSAQDTTVFLANGTAGQVLQSNGGTSAPSWVSAAPAEAITGLTIRDEGDIVGSANSITQINFVGSGVNATASGGISTITITGGGGGGSIDIQDDTTTNNTFYVGIANTSTGTLTTLNVSTTGLTFNPSTGNLVAGGTVTANSDATLKTNIKTIENALDKVLALRGVEFDRIDNGDHQIGVIAQEVEEIIPHVVYPKQPSPDYEKKSVAYANLIGLLIEAVKELNQKIEGK